MLSSAVRRLTALGVAGLFSSPAILPLVLCLCAPVSAPRHHCGDGPSTTTSLTCCCDGNTAAPASPVTTTIANISTSAPTFLEAPATDVASLGPQVRGIVDVSLPLTRSRPLFKHFSAFLI